jgi:hypothetical protein
LIKASAEDSEIEAIRRCLVSGNWDNGLKHYLPEMSSLTLDISSYEELKLLYKQRLGRESLKDTN